MVSALEAENYLISAHVYDNMAHEISPEVVREMKAFLTTLIEEK
jgi:predicted esterase